MEKLHYSLKYGLFYLEFLDWRYSRDSWGSIKPIRGSSIESGDRYIEIVGNSSGQRQERYKL